MSEISKKPRIDDGYTSGRHPIDQNGRELMGREPQIIGKREQIKNKISLDALCQFFDEKNKAYLSTALENRIERREILDSYITPMTKKQIDIDLVNQSKMEASLNRLIQKKRKSNSIVYLSPTKYLDDLKKMYKKTNYWWKIKQEIIYRVAQTLVEN